MDLINYFREMWQIAMQGQAQGIWFWAAIYTFVVCVYSLSFQIQTRYWPFVPGELIEYGIEKFGATDRVKSNQEYIVKALYRYNVSGEDFDGTRISPWIFVVSHNARLVLEKQMSSKQQLPDGRFKVFYNPKNPKKSFLIIAGKTGIFVTLVISVLPLVTFYFKYHV